MYEHRYCVEIAFLDPVDPRSTRKGLAAPAQIFGGDFTDAARVRSAAGIAEPGG